MGAFVFLLFVGVILIIGYFVMRKIDRKLTEEEDRILAEEYDRIFNEKYVYCDYVSQIDPMPRERIYLNNNILSPKEYGILNGNGKSRVKKTNRLKLKFRSKL